MLVSRKVKAAIFAKKECAFFKKAQYYPLRDNILHYFHAHHVTQSTAESEFSKFLWQELETLSLPCLRFTRYLHYNPVILRPNS